jgi:hypothetical protein
MAEQKVKVLYIAGMRRSGSTILERILGQIDGFLTVGEMQLLWFHLVRQYPCGCGQLYETCEVWKPIIEDAYGGFDRIDARAMLDEILQMRYKTPALRSKRYKETFAGFVDAIEKLYRSTARLTGCDLLVDASKSPPYGYLLEMIPSIDLYVLHLMRDARGNVYSVIHTARTEPKPKRLTYLPASTFMTTLEWNLSHLLSSKAIWPPPRNHPRRMFLRYEDFIDNPRATIEAILDFVGERGRDLSFIDGNSVELRMAMHFIAGNPGVRKIGGQVELRHDTRWHHEMSRADRALVTLMTWPLLIGHGYPLFPGHSDPPGV